MTAPNPASSLPHRLDRIPLAWAGLPKVVRAAILTATVLMGSTMLLLMWMDYIPDGVVELVATWQRADTEGRIRLASAGVGIVVISWMALVSMSQVRKMLQWPGTANCDSAGDR